MASVSRRAAVRSSLPLTTAVGLLFAVPLAAQCTPAWAPASVPGTDGSVAALVEWDPDGAGPMPTQLVIGGDFSVVGGAAAVNIAMRDPLSGVWSPLGAGLPGWGVRGLAVDAAGGLIALADPALGGTQALRWNGATWQVLGTASGAVGSWFGCAVGLPNGDVVVGGRFESVGGVAANNIARWDGFAWHALGAGLTGNQAYVAHLLLLPNGDVVATGNISAAGGAPATAVARWNGSSWAALGATATTFAGGGVVRMPNGDLVVAFGGFLGLQRWNGVAWSQEAPMPFGTPRTLALAANGDLVVGGSFSGAPAIGSVGAWNGTAWTQLGGSPNGDVTALLRTAAGLVAGGDFLSPAAGRAADVAIWNGASWQSLGGGVDNGVNALLETSDGGLVVGGTFTSIDGVPAAAVARIDPSGVTPLGGGIGGAVYALAELPNGDLVAGGNTGIARWNGTTWSPLGGGVAGSVHAMVVMPNGDLVASGVFGDYVSRWDGSSWTPLPGLDGIAWCLAVSADGTLVAGGQFPGNLARWTGTGWVAFGAVDSVVRSLAALPDGGLLAGGFFSSAGGIACDRVARWDGAGWHSLGTTAMQYADAVAAVPDGSFVAAGGIPHFVPSVKRYDGTTWQPLAGDVGGGVSANAVLARRSGEVVVGGLFDTAGGLPSANLARLVPPCPAAIVENGSGCAGSGGQNVLVARTSPWVGAPFATRATGMPAQGLGVAVFGFAAASTPLSTVTPLAVAGCELLASPDVLLSFVPTAGAAELSLPIANLPALVGQTFHEQVVAIELSPSSAITSFTSSNALAATIGSY